MMTDQNADYGALVTLLKRGYDLGRIVGHLHWDQATMLPQGAAGSRARQLALISELHHHEVTQPKIGELLDRLGSAELDADASVVVSEARREYDRATRLPASFVAKKARAQSESYHCWEQARPAGDFASFAPHLEGLLDLAQEEAQLQGFGDNPYDYYIDQHDPGVTTDHIVAWFDRLRAELPKRVRAIAESPIKPQSLEGLSIEGQEKLIRHVIPALGFDMSRGRLDTSAHPFCSGDSEDCRMTSRFGLERPLESLYSGIHETGHGLYDQGLLPEHLGTALSDAIGYAVHESQSRLWENQIGRSRAFWTWLEPKFREIYGDAVTGVDSDALYLAANAVEPGLIRVEADEVTYNLHIILRFDLERRLFSGELKVADLPEAWNALMQELFGLTPSSPRDGVLQDVHWSEAYFGYFPSYSLGNLLAAQLWEKLAEVLPERDELIAQGDFGPILDWLRVNIHNQGRRQRTLELAESLTGTPLGPDALLRYLDDRYLRLYQASV